MKGILVIMDGFGLSNINYGNAIKRAKTKNLDFFFSKYSFTRLHASGVHVGLPSKFQGSSEVGHTNIGAGRLVKQDQVRINELISSGEFEENDALISAIKNVKRNKSNFHIIGLLQDQGVHAHQDHLFAIIRLCKKYKVKPLVHVFSDGRDTHPLSVGRFIKGLEKKARIVSIIGRYYAMDRDKRWKRTCLAYTALIKKPKKLFSSVQSAVKDAYNNGESDEFVKPRLIKGFKPIKRDDSVVFFNYRADRARQLTKAFIEKDFDKFTARVKPFFVAMTDYYSELPCKVFVSKHKIENSFGEYISNLGFSQLRIAETEKYAHVTYFFSGEREKRFLGESRILIPSPKVSFYDVVPEMSALKITGEVLHSILRESHDFIIVNFANVDMIGHTGNFDAAVEAVEVVDDCIGKIVNAGLHHGFKIFITSDHGNAEKMSDKKHKKLTAHTLAKVPFCIVDRKKFKLKSGRLADIIPTILDVYNLPKPVEMSGKSLLT
jgi:2,3-bisphosphoglycerate-independent phosphoglycerate mutase